MPTEADYARYRANLQDERESATLYQALADAEHDPHLAEIYHRLAGVEERHAANWEAQLRQNNQAVPVFRPGWRIRTLSLLARRPHLKSPAFHMSWVGIFVVTRD